LIDGSKCNLKKILNPKCAFSIILPVIQLFVCCASFHPVWYGARGVKAGNCDVVTYNFQKKLVSQLMRFGWVFVVGFLVRIFRLCIV